jgi:hypothetical protein
MKELSKSLKKISDDNKFVSTISNTQSENNGNGLQKKTSNKNEGFSYRNPSELQYDNIDVNNQKDTADFVPDQDQHEDHEEGNQLENSVVDSMR